MLSWLLLTATALAHPVDGAWTLALTADEVLQRQHDAIDRALSTWPSFAVAIARQRIPPVNLPCQRYELRLDEATLRLTCDDHPPYERAATGVHSFTAPEGEQVRSRVHATATGLRISWEAEGGKRVDQFEPAEHSLEVVVRLTAPALPQAVQWTLRYQRVPPALTTD